MNPCWPLDLLETRQIVLTYTLTTSSQNVKELIMAGDTHASLRAVPDTEIRSSLREWNQDPDSKNMINCYILENDKAVPQTQIVPPTISFQHMDCNRHQPVDQDHDQHRQLAYSVERSFAIARLSSESSVCVFDILHKSGF